MTVPVYIDQAASHDEIASSAAILKAVKGKRQAAARRACAIDARLVDVARRHATRAGAEAHWQGVLAFLARVAPR